MVWIAIEVILWTNLRVCAGCLWRSRIVQYGWEKACCSPRWGCSRQLRLGADVKAAEGGNFPPGFLAYPFPKRNRIEGFRVRALRMTERRIDNGGKERVHETGWGDCGPAQDNGIRRCFLRSQCPRFYSWYVNPGEQGKIIAGGVRTRRRRFKSNETEQNNWGK
jgi:hypothetical protein